MNKSKLAEHIILAITEWTESYPDTCGDFNTLRELENGLINGVIKELSDVDKVGWLEMTALDKAVVYGISDWAEMNPVKGMTYRQLRALEGDVLGQIKEHWVDIYPNWAPNIGKLKS